MTLTQTKANGNTIHLLDCQRGTEKESRARRFAATIDRNHDAIKSIDPGIGGRVDVWLTAATQSECERITAPDGWQIAEVAVTDTGATCLKFEPTEDT